MLPRCAGGTKVNESPVLFCSANALRTTWQSVKTMVHISRKHRATRFTPSAGRDQFQRKELAGVGLRDEQRFDPRLPDCGSIAHLLS